MDISKLDSPFRELRKDDDQMKRFGQAFFDMFLALRDAGVDCETEKDEAVNGYIAVWEKQNKLVKYPRLKTGAC